ncbi:hypothetical protein FIBSPDRAFT_941692 [Athelia psychrophila]|uniref:Uncharacterized protein n=1 Tax=Athelia psychrophila TaxID=1759441 RepID=A0A167TLU1_9AGAM|nr:hypothetical protein FIBSPDRAFT_941692 [Fibularhizoctonia sp. CBS 109695]
MLGSIILLLFALLGIQLLIWWFQLVLFIILVRLCNDFLLALGNLLHAGVLMWITHVPANVSALLACLVTYGSETISYSQFMLQGPICSSPPRLLFIFGFLQHAILDTRLLECILHSGVDWERVSEGCAQASCHRADELLIIKVPNMRGALEQG